MKRVSTGLIGATLVWLALLAGPVASANAATSDDPIVVIDQAIDLLRAEKTLLFAPGRERTSPAALAAGDELLDVDARGSDALAALDRLDVSVSPNLRATLGRMPDRARNPGAHPPPPPAYDAAIAELTSMRSALEGAGGGSVFALDGFALVGVLAGAAGVGALGLALAMARRNRRRARALAALVLSDGLTGVANRRRLDLDVDRQRERGALPTAVLMVDIDRFKAFNDTYGHAAGDEVLCCVAAMLASNVREEDVVYRYGGEEFCVLLSDVVPADALDVAERIRISAHLLDLSIDEVVTVSVGVSSGPADEVDTLLERADAALFEAKGQGRDLVMVAAE